MAGEILRISDDANRVLRAAAQRKPPSKRTRPSSKQTPTVEALFRANVKAQLLAGASPYHYSPELIEQLEQDPAVATAIDRWHDRRFGR